MLDGAPVPLKVRPSFALDDEAVDHDMGVDVLDREVVGVKVMDLDLVPMYFRLGDKMH